MTEIVLAVHHGAHEIRVENDQVFCGGNGAVLGGDLAARYRSVILESERPSTLGGIVPHILLGDRSAEVIAEAMRELRFAGGLRAGENDLDHAGIGAGCGVTTCLRA